jgi:RimJ/RimL family protein N-acetyltransferase
LIAEADLRDGRRATIRRFEPSDIDAFLELATAIVEHGEGIPQTPEEGFGGAERILEAWERAGNASLYLSAWVDGQLVGEASLRRQRLQRVSHVAELGVAIHPGFHGIGLGRLLTTSLLAWARDPSTRPLRRIDLRVFASNERAIKLYESLGFEHEGRCRDFIRSADGSSYEDDLIMALLLDRGTPSQS